AHLVCSLKPTNENVGLTIAPSSFADCVSYVLRFCSEPKVIGVDASPDIASVKNEFSVYGAAMKLPRNNVSTSANAVHAGHPVTRVFCPALPEPTAGRLADYAAKQWVLHLMPAVVETSARQPSPRFLRR